MKKPIPRSPRTRAKQQQATPTRSLLSRVLRFWPVIAGIAGAAGWFAVNEEAAQKAWHWLRLDQAYTGVWTNSGEYSVDAAGWQAPEGQRVTVALTVYGREVEGDIHGDLLCNSLPWKYIFVEGRTRWWGLWGIRARAFDHIGGRKTQFAEFDIHR